MPRITRGANGKGVSAKPGDVRSLVRIQNPDDAEIALPPGEGDSDTLVAIDNPDDAEMYPEGGPAKTANLERTVSKGRKPR